MASQLGQTRCYSQTQRGFAASWFKEQRGSFRRLFATLMASVAIVGGMVAVKSCCNEQLVVRLIDVAFRAAEVE